MKLPGFGRNENAGKKRILIFDDDSYFATSLRRTLEMKGYYAEAISSVQKLDTKDTWTDFWHCIIADVDFENANLDGHVMIKRRLEERGLNCPVIVMTGQRDVKLAEIEKQYGKFFSAYLSKTDQDFSHTVLATVEREVHNGSEVAINRLESLFTELNRLDHEMDKDEISSEILGVSPRESVTTIRIMIDNFRNSQTMDQETREFYLEVLWKKYFDFLNARYE